MISGHFVTNNVVHQDQGAPYEKQGVPSRKEAGCMYLCCRELESWLWEHENRRDGPAPHVGQQSWEWFCTSPGQNNRAGAAGVSAGKVSPRLGEQENWPHSAVGYIEQTRLGHAGVLAWVVQMRGSWQAEHLSYHPHPEPGLPGSPSKHPTYLSTSGAGEGDWPEDQKQEDLRDKATKKG